MPPKKNRVKSDKTSKSDVLNKTKPVVVPVPSVNDDSVPSVSDGSALSVCDESVVVSVDEAEESVVISENSVNTPTSSKGVTASKHTKQRRVINVQSIDTTLQTIEEELVKERNNITHLLKMMVDVRKDYNRLTKEISKKRKKKNPDSGDKRKPTGALAPFKLDDELCTFLEKPLGTMMNAPEVIKSLNVYIKDNSLQEETKKTNIMPDEKLSELLQIDDGQQLTYFNIQKYLAKHYIKNS